MSESQGYFAMDMGFSQSVRHLRPGGYLLVSGIFKQDGKDGFEGSHIEGEYIRCAQDFGLLRKESVDITDNILPTLAFANDAYQSYLGPLTQTAQHFVGKSGMRKWQLLKALFAREFNNFEKVRRYYEEHFNTTFFKDNMRYTRVLFQYQPDNFEANLIEKRDKEHGISVIVSAYNEEKTVGAVLSALNASELVDEVIAVNDGSSDGTGAAIQAAAIHKKVVPIQFEKNRGKSHAMVTAALRARGDTLVFFDADLLNVDSRQIKALIEPLLEGKADMVIGDPQYTSIVVRLLDPFRPLSGQRAVRRKDLLPMLEEIRNSGFGIETLLNLTYNEQKRKIIYRKMEGLIHPIKLEKDRPARATRLYWEEGSQIATALINRAGQKQPLPRARRGGEPRPVHPHARRRVPGRDPRAAGQDRHGPPEHRHARPGHLPHPPRPSPPHRRRMVRLPALRLHPLPLGHDRGRDPLHLHAGIREQPRALRLGARHPAHALPPPPV